MKNIQNFTVSYAKNKLKVFKITNISFLFQLLFMYFLMVTITKE